MKVTGAACKGDCDNYSKYESSLSSTYVEDGRIFSQSYEDGSEATGRHGNRCMPAMQYICVLGWRLHAGSRSACWGVVLLLNVLGRTKRAGCSPVFVPGTIQHRFLFTFFGKAFTNVFANAGLGRPVDQPVRRWKLWLEPLQPPPPPPMPTPTPTKCWFDATAIGPAGGSCILADANQRVAGACIAPSVSIPGHDDRSEQRLILHSGYCLRDPVAAVVQRHRQLRVPPLLSPCFPPSGTRCRFKLLFRTIGRTGRASLAAPRPNETPTKRRALRRYLEHRGAHDDRHLRRDEHPVAGWLQQHGRHHGHGGAQRGQRAERLRRPRGGGAKGGAMAIP